MKKSRPNSRSTASRSTASRNTASHGAEKESPRRGKGKPHGGNRADKLNFTSNSSGRSEVGRHGGKERTHASQRLTLRPTGQVLFGLHAVREAWQNPRRTCNQLWVTNGAYEELTKLLEQTHDLGSRRRPEPVIVERAVLDNLTQGAVHQGVVMTVEPLPELSLAELIKQEAELLVILDQVTDPHNVGAILRSAAALGAQALIVTERNAPQHTGTLAKTACGALEHIPIVSVVNLARALDELREADYFCVGLAEEGGKELSEYRLSGKIALVLGAEGDGLRRLTRERCDALAYLPTGGAIGSLNVSNAAAIALYEARRQRKEA